MAAERCEACDHLMTRHTVVGGCQHVTTVRNGAQVSTAGATYLCPCNVKPSPPRCKAQEGATGIACDKVAGHRTSHKGKHIPRTGGTESVGYWMVVEWPYTEYDSANGIQPDPE